MKSKIKPTAGKAQGGFEAYLDALPAGQRRALRELRKAILAAAPEAEECIRYGLPAFQLDGQVLVYLGASAKHCSFYPGSGTAVAAHAGALEGFDTSKGTIRFQPSKPLPAALVRKIVAYRRDEAAARGKAAGRGRTRR